MNCFCFVLTPQILAFAAIFNFYHRNQKQLQLQLQRQNKTSGSKPKKKPNPSFPTTTTRNHTENSSNTIIIIEPPQTTYSSKLPYVNNTAMSTTITPLQQKESQAHTTPDHNTQLRMNPTHTQPPSSQRNSLTKTQIVALSGAMSGFLAGVAVCPLDVAKTRLQAQNSESVYRGVYGTLHIIHKNEGVKGLYKGLVPIILGYFPTWMIYFTVYEKAKLTYPDLNKKYMGISNDFINHSMSAFTAGSVSTTLTNPIWVIKTRLMLQTNENVRYNSTLDAFVKMYRQEGPAVFYSGLTPSLFGLFHVAIHFPVYEKLKNSLNIKNNDEQRLLKLIIASTVSKICASSLTYPHEILRTRMQLKKDQSLLEIINYIYSNYGLKGFYKGFGTNLMRTIPSSGITLISFEYISKYLTSILGEQPQNA